MKDRKQKGSSAILLILIFLIIIVGVGIYLSLAEARKRAELDYEAYYKENILNSENEAKGYYYNQLPEPSKIMYATILSNIDSLKNGNGKIEFPPNLSDSVKESGNEEYNYFQTAWDAISLENVDIFYINTKSLSLSTKKISIFGYNNYEFALEPYTGQTYYNQNFRNRAEIDSAINQVNNIVDEIIAKSKGSVYDRVKYAHDWIVDNLEYDNNGANKDNIYGAFIDKNVVCEGYAEGFKYLMDKMNIPCVLVYGDAVNNAGEKEAHAWNYVKMPDEKWYAVDTTWDDPIYIGASKLFKTNSQKYENFLRGSENFNKSHVNDGDVSGTGQNFIYPELSVNDYK